MTTSPCLVEPARQPVYLKTEALGKQITELCAYIYAATYQLLVLIREFDEQEGWSQPGLCSCAHWLNFKCGIGLNAAREKVRVARALKDLPKISQAFERGELSYSKVRAMTRIADAGNEDYLLNIAHHGTAYHVEQLVSKYRRCRRLQEADDANQQHEERTFSYYFDADGCLIFKGRLPPEQGTLVVKALERAMDQSFQNEAEDVTAETRDPIEARRADALGALAETYLNDDQNAGSTGDRYQVVVHVAEATLREDVTAETPTGPDVDRAHLEDGPQVAAETSRRIACDCSTLKVVDNEFGEPLSIGRKSRSIPPAIRRALRLRDRGCRFPGCTHKRFVDGHHIKHWADGGETSLDNLVLLCRRHHRLVHEGGYRCERTTDGRFEFTAPDARILPESERLPGIVLDQDPRQWMHRNMSQLEIDADTCVPKWYAGDTMDWNMAVSALFPN